MTEDKYHYYQMEWQGTSSLCPVGATIGGKVIQSSHHGKLLDGNSDEAAFYLAVSFPKEDNDHTSIIFIQTLSKDITPPPGGTVKALEGAKLNFAKKGFQPVVHGTGIIENSREVPGR